MDENSGGEFLVGIAIVLIVVAALLWPLVKLAIIGLIGAQMQKKHLSELARREQDLPDLLVTDLKTPPPGMLVGRGEMVDASVVIAPDHFKSFLARFRKFFGGEFQGLLQIQERARREALLRMKERAVQLGASAVCNVRLETSTLAGQRRGTIAGCEIIAYGTALFEPGATPVLPSAPPPQVPSV